MKANDQFEKDLHHVEEILDQAKAGLMGLLPEIESLEAAATGKASEQNSATQHEIPPHDSLPAGAAPFVERSQFAWFRFFSTHKA
jgi:hypothetical protein